jgi:DNA ligase-1
MLPELQKYNGIDPKGFYISEKLNGVRAFWNGLKFISKNGNPFALPTELLTAMPQGKALDGELYAGGDLSLIAGLCRRKVPAPLENWKKVTFQVFDAPDRSLLYRERHELLTNYARTTDELPPFCTIVKQTICQGRRELLTNYHEIKERGGEGIVLKSPLHLYRPGSSELAQKIKYNDDFEIDGVTYDENGQFLAVRDYE